MTATLCLVIEDSAAAAAGGEARPVDRAWIVAFLLAEDRAEAGECLAEGVEIALADGQGPTVRLIGAALCVAGRALDCPCEKVGNAMLEDLAAQLPAAASRIDRLRRAHTQGVADPLGLLAEILPFNFR